jgi:hypothetical protein
VAVRSTPDYQEVNMERTRDAEPAHRRPAAEHEPRVPGLGGLLSSAVGQSPVMVAQRQRLHAFAAAPPRAGSGLVQRHVFLDIPPNLHEVDDFGNWYTIAAEYKQQQEIASLEQLKAQSVQTPEPPKEETAPVLIDPADFVTSLRDKTKPVDISLAGGVKLQVHGIPNLDANTVANLGKRCDLREADLEQDGSIKAGKNVAVGNAFVSAQALANYITNTYNVPWDQFYPMYCFTAEQGGQWANTGRGGLGPGSLLNTPGRVVTIAGGADMTGWAAFEGTPKKYISKDGAWNKIDDTPIATLGEYIANASAGNLSKPDLAALLRTALDEVYAEVAPEYGAFCRYLSTKGAITGETPNPWGL